MKKSCCPFKLKEIFLHTRLLGILVYQIPESRIDPRIYKSRNNEELEKLDLVTEKNSSSKAFTTQAKKKIGKYEMKIQKLNQKYFEKHEYGMFIEVI